MRVPDVLIRGFPVEDLDLRAEQARHPVLAMAECLWRQLHQTARQLDSQVTEAVLTRLTDLARAFATAPLAAMPVEYLTTAIENRAVGAATIVGRAGPTPRPVDPRPADRCHGRLAARIALRTDRDGLRTHRGVDWPSCRAAGCGGVAAGLVSRLPRRTSSGVGGRGAAGPEAAGAGPLRGVTIRRWQVGNLEPPRKQRHAARRIWQQLLEEEGAVVAESSVRNLVARLKAGRRGDGDGHYFPRPSRHYRLTPPGWGSAAHTPPGLGSGSPGPAWVGVGQPTPCLGWGSGQPTPRLGWGSGSPHPAWVGGRAAHTPPGMGVGQPTPRLRWGSGSPHPAWDGVGQATPRLGWGSGAHTPPGMGVGQPTPRLRWGSGSPHPAWDGSRAAHTPPGTGAGHPRPSADRARTATLRPRPSRGQS